MAQQTFRTAVPVVLEQGTVWSNTADRLQSMTGMIPYFNAPPPIDPREPILWASFEGFADPNSDEQRKPYLVIAYAVGFQVWDVRDANVFTEVVSYRNKEANQRLRCVHVLASPAYYFDSPVDQYKDMRPLLAYYEEKGTRIDLLSLSTRERLSVSIEGSSAFFEESIQSIRSNSKVVAVASRKSINIYDSASFQLKGPPISCSATRLLPYNPIALGERWLAFVTDSEIPERDKRKGGGLRIEQEQTQGEAIVDTVKGSIGVVSSAFQYGRNKLFGSSQEQQEPQPAEVSHTVGCVKIIDIKDSNRTLAHFRAYSNSAIEFLAFNPTGTLLFTADEAGHKFHLFHLARSQYLATLQPNPKKSTVSETRFTAHHVYTLFRGVTDAIIRDVAFSLDSRWVSVTSANKTVHVYPINALLGGEAGPKSHNPPIAVNSFGAFTTSAGLGSQSIPEVPIVITELAQQKFGSSKSDEPPTENSRVVVNFGLHCPQMADSTSPRRGVPPNSLFAFTAEGKVVEHVLQVDFVPATKPPKDNKEFLMQTTGQLWNFARTTWLGQEAPKADDAPIDYQTLEGTLELRIHPHRVWNVCREAHWRADKRAPTASALQVKEQRPLSSTNRNMVSDDRATLEAMMNTYIPPPRRIWMGPQFKFWVYTQSSSDLNSLEEISTDLSLGPGPTTSYPIATTRSGNAKQDVANALQTRGEATPPKVIAQARLSDQAQPPSSRLRHLQDDFEEMNDHTEALQPLPLPAMQTSSGFVQEPLSSHRSTEDLLDEMANQSLLPKPSASRPIRATFNLGAEGSSPPSHYQMASPQVKHSSADFVRKSSAELAFTKPRAAAPKFSTPPSGSPEGVRPTPPSEGLAAALDSGSNHPSRVCSGLSLASAVGEEDGWQSDFTMD